VEFTAKWGAQYPAITRLWENAWSEFVPFLDYDVEIRRVICSTNDRITEYPLPAGDSGPRAQNNRTGRAQVPLPGDPIPRPHRPR
jgi:putative transposase